MSLYKKFTEFYDAEDLEREFIDYDRNYYSRYGYEALIELFNLQPKDTELDVIDISESFAECSPSEAASELSDSLPSLKSKLDGTDLTALEIARILSKYTMAAALPNGNVIYKDLWNIE